MKSIRRPRSASLGKVVLGLRALTTPAILLPIFVIILFVMGGASRADVLSLVFLRPFAILVLASGLLTLNRQQIRQFRWLIAFALVALFLVVAHLIPLPPIIWESLPGREIIVDIDRLANIGDAWRPLTMDPPGTWNALWSLSVPLAVLVLAVQLDIEGHLRMVRVVIFMGIASAMLAFLQVLGDPSGPLYLYRITNNGIAVGLFANRNHQAVMLASLIPLLAVWIASGRFMPQQKKERRNLDPYLATVLIAFLIPLILVTGSRAGMLAAVLAIPMAMWILAQGGRRYSKGGLNRMKAGKAPASQSISRNSKWLMVLAGTTLMCGMVVLTYSSGQGLAIERFFEKSYSEELRGQIAPHLVELSQFYAPFGTGVGSFERVFAVHEPSFILGPQYLNHVHNDYLEVLLTAGIPGAILLLSAVFLVLYRLYRITLPWRVDSIDTALSRTGFSVLALLAVASAVDYPLRVPSIQAVAMLSAVWLFRKGGRLKRSTSRD